MQEYIANGYILGWLINTQNKQVEIYRLGEDIEVLNSPQTILVENVLTGFIWNLEYIW